jgi:4a-hydroxytetrahydrobiopterin dehydratase
MAVEVTLYTRQNCPLCDKVKEAIAASGAGVRIVEVDIDRDEELRRKYTDDVPVVAIGGREVFRHRMDAGAFATALLAAESCVPCRGGVPPLRGAELETLSRGLGAGWSVVREHHLEKEFRFPDFASALAFTNRVGAIAEAEGHHPDLHLAWGKVGVTIWTHAIDGLTRSDFVLAAKIEREVLE